MKVHVIFLESEKLVESTLRSLAQLADFFNLSLTQILDDLAQLRVTQTVSFSLFELLNKKELDAQAPLMKLMESVLVLCPHKIIVESGFSKMKFFENDYRCNLGLEMYNAYRVIADNFDRDDFEDFEPTDSLFESDKASLKRNKEEVAERRASTKFCRSPSRNKGIRTKKLQSS